MAFLYRPHQLDDFFLSADRQATGFSQMIQRNFIRSKLISRFGLHRAAPGVSSEVSPEIFPKQKTSNFQDWSHYFWYPSEILIGFFIPDLVFKE